ncbi:MAG: 2-succinyl-5-enolpyruvyl-6-hydroxy-3-cyclohexene-1-carboxylic-acid synthase [Lentimicrobium sp.]|nr:2-succinyl-5-enolpyruvyl-6-hydroxy-3-cyclohexene-1-carboxylic-acid synthase [Lentimicrobium sp.]
MKNNQLHLLADILHQKGISRVVASPGSRNAPAIVILNRHPGLVLKSVIDERSAGFFALGMAQQLKETVALLCTSGSAALNYAPAVAEAYYQKIPLLVITADRPEEWIDQGDGQTIRQQNLFNGYVRKSFHLPQQASEKNIRWHFERSLCEAIDRTQFPAPGPVHVNLPLSEPLYDIEWPEKTEETRYPSIVKSVSLTSANDLDYLGGIWNTTTSKMIVVGQLPPDERLKELLSHFSDDPSVIILTETTANIFIPDTISCIDRTIELLEPDELIKFRPDLLLSLGGAVVSKKVKTLLRQMKPTHHWHINPDTDDFHLDTYQSLTYTIPSDPITFIGQLISVGKKTESNYKKIWLDRSRRHAERHEHFLHKTPYSDLSVYHSLFSAIPRNSHLHLGNSTPVRYAQLFEEASEFVCWSNRGTSGIDGCVSTAAGAAEICNFPIVVITGDIGFLYDSNALWNSNLSPRLRIVLINNGGGNIFRVIPGPDKYDELETLIETGHELNVKGIATTFGLSYFEAHSQVELDQRLPEFFNIEKNNKPALIEVFTSNKISAQVLKDYFKNIAL